MRDMLTIHAILQFRLQKSKLVFICIYVMFECTGEMVKPETIYARFDEEQPRRNMTGQRVGGKYEGNSARPVCSDFSQNPLDFRDKNVPLLQVQGGHRSHEGS